MSAKPHPLPLPLDPNSYAQTEADAESRYNQWRSIDPFPEVPPALLNTADLLDYIRVTGMISPFRPDAANPSELLKPASCALALGGEYLYWEERSDLIWGGSSYKPVQGTLEPGDELILARNSIVYAGIDPKIRMPDYIAARFNLTIKNVYRGILVGTGPLVDPGFDGRLFLPLHNLTSNEYRFTAGEPLVWMEFTKLTPHERWDSRFKRERSRSGEDRVGIYVEFPPRKHARRTLRAYTNRAADGPIMSSIPELVGRAQKSAQAAEEEARSLSNRFTFFSFVGVAALVIALVAVFLQTVGFIEDARKTDRTRQTELTQLESRLDAVTKSGDAQATRIAKLENALARARRAP